MGSDLPRVKGTPGTKGEFRGRCKERLLNERSKSEHVGVILETVDGWLSLYLVGDNPFSHEKLRLHLGKNCSVQGVWRGLTLRVEECDFEVLDLTDKGRVPDDLMLDSKAAIVLTEGKE